MSRMLVSYRSCGCRVSALFDLEDIEGLADFFNESVQEGLIIQKEDRPDIGALRCSEHEEKSVHSAEKRVE